MPLKKLRSFSVSFLKILDENGECDKKLMPKLGKEQIRKMYEYMVLSRVFDEKALNLQRQGRLGTYASVRGQEASQVGSAFALSPEDWLFPSFRENAAYITRGVPMEMVFLYWGGNEIGEKMPPDINNFTVSIPVGTQIPHAVGAAWAMKLRNKKSASIVYFGDGATSKGDFHEGMNFAGVFKIPVVFLCQNNQFAISLRVDNQTASKTLAQKAIAYGFEGVRVDGNDIFAVYRATKDALEKAKNGKGPTLIECFTYRIEHHTTSDDSWRYRTKEEVEEWKKKDPIDRMKKYMIKKNIWNEEDDKKLLEDAKKKVEDAVKKYESMAKPNMEDMFSYTYADMTPQLKEQMEELKKVYDKRDGGKNGSNEHGAGNQQRAGE